MVGDVVEDTYDIALIVASAEGMKTTNVYANAFNGFTVVEVRLITE